MTYNSVTESAIRDAIKNAGSINMRLVAAQEARRVLDRLVGYTLSFPLSDAIGLVSGHRPVECKRQR
ncbi:MAG: hypothetical protein ABR561_07425 [Guyparkeria sp.]